MSDVLEYRFIDKQDWGPGPWQDEPDKLQWLDEQTGLDCLAVRHPTYGHWCGYVGVPEGHPAYKQHYDSVPVDVHGGLTFGDGCREEDQPHGICHVPFPGRPEKVFWLGFDACHAWDLQPAKESLFKSLGLPRLSAFTPVDRGEVYRDLPYIREECTSLARQLKDLEIPVKE